MIECYGMSGCKPRFTPSELKIEELMTEEDGGKEITDPKEYREIVGSLIYAMTCTRPDISWIVSKLSQTLQIQKWKVQ